MRGKKLVSVAGMAALLAALLGCQAVFTFSPLSILQRDPSALTPAQQMKYAEDALASGDADAILSAYNALQADAAGSTDAGLNLLAAHLAMELSGVPGLLNGVIAGDIDFSAPDLGKFDDLLEGLDTFYLVDASSFYQGANDNNGDLDSTDYLLGAACILFAGTDGEQVSTADLVAKGDARDFLQDGIDALPDGDPAADLLSGFQSFVDGL